jgi:protein involved in polysaccharide export with SLBB domain
LQVGDAVTVKFWNSPELNEDVVIRPDGMISLPFVDEVRAAGLTPAELDAELTRRYAVELAQPDLTVIVTNAPPPVVYVGGEVASPGAQELRGRRTLFQAVQQAGGFRVTARRKQVVLIRTLGPEETVARAIDLRPVMSGADPGVDLVLQPFDVVFVPRTKVEDLRLFVDQYVYGQLPIAQLSVIRVFRTSN